MIVEQVPPNEAEVRELMAFLVAMEEEAATLPVSVPKAAASIYQACAAGVAFAARAEEGGPIIGSLGMAEVSPWYSEATALVNIWLYVLPEHRGGPAFRELARPAIEIGRVEGKPVIITLEGPNREARGQLLLLGFYPAGRGVRIG